MFCKEHKMLFAIWLGSSSDMIINLSSSALANIIVRLFWKSHSFLALSWSEKEEMKKFSILAVLSCFVAHLIHYSLFVKFLKPPFLFTEAVRSNFVFLLLYLDSRIAYCIQMGKHFASCQDWSASDAPKIDFNQHRAITKKMELVPFPRC